MHSYISCKHSFWALHSCANILTCVIQTYLNITTSLRNLVTRNNLCYRHLIVINGGIFQFQGKFRVCLHSNINVFILQYAAYAKLLQYVMFCVHIHSYTNFTTQQFYNINILRDVHCM